MTHSLWERDNLLYRFIFFKNGDIIFCDKTGIEYTYPSQHNEHILEQFNFWCDL